MAHMRARRDEEGPSSGILTVDEAVVLRDFRGWEDGFWAARNAAAFLDETRPGIMQHPV